jgi:hypothetical protein
MSLATFLDQPVWRVVPTRFPPIAIFERAASPEDIEDNLRLEMAFSSHHGEGMRILSLPKEEWVSGPGCGFIMAPFVYAVPSRFTDGSFGVFYAGLEEATATEEVAFHRARFMASTGQPPMVLEHQVLRAVANGEVTDIRGRQAQYPERYDPEPEDDPTAETPSRLRVWLPDREKISTATPPSPRNRPDQARRSRRSRPMTA